MALIETVNLTHQVGGRDLLKNINLKIKKGEVFALIGPIGAGKTMLLRLLSLMDTPTGGKIYFDGVDTTQSARVRLEMRRRMSFVLQKSVVFNTSVYENIACGLGWRGIKGRALREKVNRILEMVGVAEWQNRNARTLSGGEVQRVAIARAIAVEPEVLLLDEPTANLDPLSAAKIEELVINIIRQSATTIIMATHDRSQGQRLADRIGVLMSGELVQIGSSGDIFASPRNREVAEFVGVENIIDGVVVANEGGVVTIEVGGKLIEAIGDYAKGEAVWACVRPEEVTLSLVRVSSSARNSFAGEISRVVAVGALARVEIDCGFPLVALVTRRSAEEMGLEKGKPVFATFKATGVHVIRRDCLLTSPP